MSLIYTPVPIEQIFPDNLENLQYQEIDIGLEKKIIVERISESQCKIVRLISTDCNDYLYSRYQPGTIINLQFM